MTQSSYSVPPKTDAIAAIIAAGVMMCCLTEFSGTVARLGPPYGGHAEWALAPFMMFSALSAVCAIWPPEAVRTAAHFMVMQASSLAALWQSFLILPFVFILRPIWMERQI